MWWQGVGDGGPDSYLLIFAAIVLIGVIVTLSVMIWADLKVKKRSARKEDEMSEIQELKPCPFCGQTDKLTLDSLGDPNDWFVECDRCHLGTHAIFVGARRAQDHWNTRAYEADHAAEIAALNQEIERLKKIEAACGKENCMGQRVEGCATWVREERLLEAERRITEQDKFITDLQADAHQHTVRGDELQRMLDRMTKERDALRTSSKALAEALEPYVSQGEVDYEHDCVCFDFIVADRLQTAARAALAEYGKVQP